MWKLCSAFWYFMTPSQTLITLSYVTSLCPVVTFSCLRNDIEGEWWERDFLNRKFAGKVSGFLLLCHLYHQIVFRTLFLQTNSNQDPSLSPIFDSFHDILGNKMLGLGGWTPISRSHIGDLIHGCVTDVFVCLCACPVLIGFFLLNLKMVIKKLKPEINENKI